MAEAGTGATFSCDRPCRIHVVGVGGAGMNAIAAVLHWMGHAVTGSDLKDSPGLDRLRSLGVTVDVGHRPEQVGDAEFVAVSTAIPEHNVELSAARAAGVPVLSRADVLAAIAAARSTVAVGGTHGKTTTSSMLALALIEAGLEPSFIIGGDVNEVGSGAVWGAGSWFVVEADESDGTFLRLPREVAVVTNVEPDHLDHYGGVAALEAAFDEFVTGATTAVVCADDPGAAALAARHGSVTYGEADGATYRMVDVVTSGSGVDFTLVHAGRTLGRVELPVPGRHNALDAAAAAAAAIEIGAEPAPVLSALGRFGGVARRFERRGSAAGVSFIDDYAHLPTEVAAAVDAASDGSWDRIVCVFQPHRFSRTEALGASFADAFQGVDHLVVTGVYSAGEVPRPGVSGRLVADAVVAAHPDADVVYLERRGEVLAHLVEVLAPGDLCLTLGAGDLTTLPDDVLSALDAR